MTEEVRLRASDPAALEPFDTWLEENDWYKWRVVERVADGTYRVDAGHADYFRQQARRFGLAVE